MELCVLLAPRISHVPAIGAGALAPSGLDTIYPDQYSLATQAGARVALHRASCAYQKACFSLVWLCQEAVTATTSDLRQLRHLCTSLLCVLCAFHKSSEGIKEQ